MAKGKSHYIRLSYDISSETTANAAPFHKAALKITPVERMEQGDSANTSLVELFNHCGTHIDMPNHKIADGKTLTDCSIDEFIFEKPFILDVHLNDEEDLSKADLIGYKKELAACDILLIRTGFNTYRLTDLKRYTWKTPGVSIEAAQCLVKNCPNIRAVGIDFLSFETLRDTTHESKAHIALLNRNVKIIEDMNLNEISNKTIKRVFAFPLFIEGVDSFHATVVAEVSAE